MLKKLSVLLLVLALVSVCPGVPAEKPASLERTVHTDLLLTVDYGDQVTYVIGHKSPDADTVGSAIAYAGLLQQLGISAKAAVAGPVNQETKYALDLFGIDQPEVLSDAAGKQFVLVDHSEYTQALDSMRSARIVCVVDHHGIGDIRNTERIVVWSLPAGATASIVWSAYQACDVEISREMARAMLFALLSDTKNMTSMNVTKLDREAYADLNAIAAVDDVAGLYDAMKAAKSAYTGMTPTEIFYDDYKEYIVGEYTFGIGDVFADSEESILTLSERIEAEFPKIYASSKMDMLFCRVSTENRTRMIWCGDGAEALVRAAFPDYDGSGSLIFEPKAPRKSKVVPPLTRDLEEKQK